MAVLQIKKGRLNKPSRLLEVAFAAVVFSLKKIYKVRELNNPVIAVSNISPKVMTYVSRITCT